MNVSQQVTFRNIVRDGSGNVTSDDVIPLQRNHLYNVVLTPKYDNGALVFDEIDYAIQVVDWQNGETIVFAGDANLTATSTPSFTVTGAKYLRGTEVDGKTNPTRVVGKFSAFTLTLTATSQTTGTMLECAAFDSSKGSYDLVSTTNDANGNLVETYEINVNNNVLCGGATYTFTISNAINTALSRTFVLKAGIDADELCYGDIIYDDCTIVHLGETKPSGAGAPTPVGVVVYKSNTPTNVCEAGIVNVDGETVAGKALVVALQMVETLKYADGAAASIDEDNTLFPNVGSDLTLNKGDYRGYEKTQYLASGCNNSHNHPAADFAWDYHNTQLGSALEDYLDNATGWFLPSVGQTMAIFESCKANGNSSGTNKDASATSYYWNAINSDLPGAANLVDLIEYAGGTYINTHINTSSEADATHSILPCISTRNNYGYWWGNRGDFYKTNPYGVLPILAY